MLAGKLMRGHGPRRPPPTEDVEQRQLAQWLDFLGVLWAHVPNGGKRHISTARALKAAGVKIGVPDVLIFDRPPSRPDAVGVAIELKRTSGSRTYAAQLDWIDDLKHRGWYAFVAKGADDAIRTLQCLGFGDTKHGT